MPELRQEPLTDTWVIIATERSKRPSDFASDKKDTGGGPDNCPFCLGNEHMTPPEILALRESGTEPNAPGWSIRVFENKFAALKSGGEARKGSEGPYENMDGVGAHEVIVESADHNRNLQDEKVEHVEEILRTWRARFQQLADDANIKYTQLFKNYGSVAGASLAHPHSQLIATPLVPKNISEEIKGMENYYERNGRCYFCDALDFEKREQERVVAENNTFLSFCPYAARFPFEIWIVPKAHQEHFHSMTDSELHDLAQILKESVGKLAGALNDPPYNLVVHTAPYNFDKNKRYHWHIEILPRLTKVAGFEWGTGYYINPTPPESAADFLRQVH